MLVGIIADAGNRRRQHLGIKPGRLVVVYRTLSGAFGGLTTRSVAFGTRLSGKGIVTAIRLTLGTFGTGARFESGLRPLFGALFGALFTARFRTGIRARFWAPFWSRILTRFRALLWALFAFPIVVRLLIAARLLRLAWTFILPLKIVIIAVKTALLAIAAGGTRIVALHFAIGDHAEIVIGELQEIFGLHAIIVQLRFLRQLAVFFQQLRGIATRAAVNPVALIAAVTAASAAIAVAATTPTIVAIVVAVVVIALVIQGKSAFSLGPAFW